MEEITVKIKLLSGIELSIRINKSATVGELRQRIQEQRQAPPASQSMVYQGSMLHIDEKTLEELNIVDGSVVSMLGGFRKPVIYLFTPNDIEHVKVKLDLIQSWKLDAIYPPTQVTKSDLTKGDRIEWNVSVNSQGILTDHSTKLQLSYLFWEAIPIKSAQISIKPGSFDPLHPSITPLNSVLFESVTSLIAYLDPTLNNLSVPTSARNDLITYWLPSFQRHRYIAIRFVPQREYEQSAQLTVEDVKSGKRPDVTTRVFMLFRGVREAEVSNWKDEGLKADEVDWRKVIGVMNKATDESLWRVLEWGGMEILG